MTDHELIESKIFEMYFKILSEGFVPKSSDVRKKVVELAESECLDIVYGKEFMDSITDNAVTTALSKFKHVHYHGDRRLYECQNPLFHEWFGQQVLLLLG